MLQANILFLVLQDILSAKYPDTSNETWVRTFIKHRPLHLQWNPSEWTQCFRVKYSIGHLGIIHLPNHHLWHLWWGRSHLPRYLWGKKLNPSATATRCDLVSPWDRSPPPSPVLHPPAEKQSPRARSEPDWTSWGLLPPGGWDGCHHRFDMFDP